MWEPIFYNSNQICKLVLKHEKLLHTENIRLKIEKLHTEMFIELLFLLGGICNLKQFVIHGPKVLKVLLDWPQVYIWESGDLG